MGKMTIKCNSEQLKYIQKDFEDASVPVDMSYGPFHKGKSEVNLFYDDAEDGIVEGIVKYRMRNNVIFYINREIFRRICRNNSLNFVLLYFRN